MNVIWCPQCRKRVEVRIVAVEVDNEGFNWDLVRCAPGGHLIRRNRYP